MLVMLYKTNKLLQHLLFILFKTKVYNIADNKGLR